MKKISYQNRYGDILKKRYCNVFKYKYITIRIAVIAFFIILLSNSAYTQQSGGGYAESYLLRNIGARAISMAGAYSAIADEPTAIFYNPAGLTGLNTEPTFTTMHSFMEWGRTQSSLVWGQNMFEDFGFGFGINHYSTGEFDWRDKLGRKIGNLTDRQLEIIAGAAYKTEFSSIGIGVKYLSHWLEGTATCAQGYGVDIGTMFNIMGLFDFALSMQNISSIMFWNTPSEENSMLPYTIRAGASMGFSLGEDEISTRNSFGDVETMSSPKYVLFGLDAILNQYENAPAIALGVEVVPHEIIAFRGGLTLMEDEFGVYKLLAMNTWGLGISIRPDFIDYNMPFKIHIDYTVAADKLSTNGIGHHLSLQLEMK